MRANLINIPADAQVGIRYQVNLSGTGWLDPAEDGAEAGNASAEAPLEAICMQHHMICIIRFIRMVHGRIGH